MPKPEPTIIVSVKRELQPVMDTLKTIYRKLESIEELLKKVHKHLTDKEKAEEKSKS